MKYALRICVLLIAFSCGQAHADGVIASIKPLHSLVASVMAGDDNAPLLLVGGAASPHDFSLKPSQALAIENADIIFYMGDNFETFLPKALANAPSKLKRVAMEKTPGATLYPLRANPNFEPDDDDAGQYDLHMWMGVSNAKAMVAEIARQLSAQYPAKAALYQANAQKLQLKLDALDANLKARMAPLKGKPFIVFHDAYQYFEKAYGVDDIGSITLNPERPPSAERLSDIRDKVKDDSAVCVFREPQFEAGAMENMLAGTKARSGVLDPEGALLTPGPDLYFQLMNDVAKELETCLK